MEWETGNSPTALLLDEDIHLNDQMQMGGYWNSLLPSRNNIRLLDYHFLFLYVYLSVLVISFFVRVFKFTFGDDMYTYMYARFEC